eukprot:TRINITY_DN2064_c1_g1_i1.p1 TRINITY_DN2064_c1_g1~~TRINITY_DN2064_c1_g1_i1.p1  ORF type:complete len:461 (+),score=37.25 TRINITY_DN2064_c1_g1_i1:53-1384(+)
MNSEGSCNGYQRLEPVSLSVVPHSLSAEQVVRYSRHAILPQFGVHKQEILCRSKVLVIGCGGLGCPVALYLAGSGVGTLGLVDCDEVEISNLHRQIGHSEKDVGVHKAESLKDSCLQINSTIQVNVYKEGFTPQNAVQIASGYDAIVDASDNAPTRYLVSDVCVVTGKPLISGAAIGLYGQLTVYNLTKETPCYRCLHPESPSAENCQRCNDAGVLGTIPGIIGSLQALETIKVVTKLGDALDRKLLIFDAMSMQFRQVKLRDRNLKCVACGDNPDITSDNLATYDYYKFTGQQMNDKDEIKLEILSPDQRLEAQELFQYLQQQDNQISCTSGIEQKEVNRLPNQCQENGIIVLDVRPKEQFEIGHIYNSYNIPIGSLQRTMSEIQQLVTHNMVCVVCRRGNDSQIAVQQLEQSENFKGFQLKDLIGGLESWSRTVDNTLPLY